MKSLITTDNQLNIQIAPGISLIGNSLVMTKNATIEGASEALRVLMEFDKKNQWWIGDLINAAEANLGEKYTQMDEITGLQYSTLTTYAHTANKFKPEERRNISFDHHRIVQKFDADKRSKYLQIAIDNNMRLGEFRNYVNTMEGKKKKAGESGDGDDREKKYVAALKTVPVNRGDLWDILADEHAVHIREEDLAMLGIPLPKAVDSIIVIGIRYTDEMEDDQAASQAQLDLDESDSTRTDKEPEVPFG